MASYELLFWHLYANSKGNHERLNQHSRDLGPPKCETRTLIVHPDIGLW
jgi:hypothetical protein